MLSRIRSVTESALQVGSLTPLQTEVTNIAATASSPPFQIRLLRKYRKPRVKNVSKNNSAPKKNPFLPYDPSLFVEDLSSSHVLLLNKFPVVAHHTLIVTRAFEQQSSLLTAADHAAMWKVVNEFPSLAFYNAGPIAGASQPHKHLQVVHAQTQNGNDAIPFDDDVYSGVKGLGNNEITTIKSFPFVHAVAQVEDVAIMSQQGNLEQAAHVSMERYIQLISHLEKRLMSLTEQEQIDVESDTTVRPFPYNFLCTSRWMMIVPRRQECYGSISVNALGFAGFLLVRDEESLEDVKRVGGMRVIVGVTFNDTDETG